MASPIDTLRQELALITALLDLMKQEQQMLVSADTDGLAALTPQKSQLISQMAMLAKQRHQSLGAAGFAAKEAGMEAWLDGCKDSTASPLWQALLERTREAKEQNRINGMLINKQLAHNQNMINAMRQPASAADTGFYGPTGQAAPSGPSRRFVVG